MYNIQHTVSNSHMYASLSMTLTIHYTLVLHLYSNLPICLYFIHPCCLYANPIQSDIVKIYIFVFIWFTTAPTWYSVNYSIVCVLYIKPKVHVVTGIFSLGCTYLQIVLVQFDNNVICKA